ncbi:MAG: tRNA (N(6)-L-threonylcarbamoyladenosine(37)-C(2))-methylthiotransferase MtaB [Ruminococcaceae bacterium]|jgi:threonylcarbamoyladenosine tRNA methylthiotransferase MtaB|nr:tRNA (N(6)-L-threonylcarbamoyladenosine(37)-C(2))-methylthiotransferase MtaB [Oscillospiraceae bacterium]
MNQAAPTVSVLTLGCRVNQYESDALCAVLKERGVRIVPFGDPADLAVVNTCTVTGESDRKSRQMIRRAAQNALHVVVTGCFAQIAGDEIASMENVTFVCGNSGKASLAETVLAVLGGSLPAEKNGVTPPTDEGSVRLTLPSPQRTRSYVKIEDGCGNRCSYCLIRFARGPVRSKPREIALEEVRALARAGAKEVILTGIETASYGMDFENRQPYGHALADLIRDADRIPGIERIGLGSLEPTVLNDYFSEAVRDCAHLLPHFHLSVQSGSSAVLRSMRRRYTAEAVLTAVERIRAVRPDVTYSADIITGFPGETEEDFRLTADFCREAEFLHLHIFPFSERTGTEAAEMEGRIPVRVRRERAEELSKIGDEIRRNLLERYVADHGSVPVRLLVEKNGGGLLSGHSEHFVELKRIPGRAQVGSVVPVLLEDTDGVICTGRVAQE